MGVLEFPLDFIEDVDDKEKEEHPYLICFCVIMTMMIVRV